MRTWLHSCDLARPHTLPQVAPKLWDTFTRLSAGEQGLISSQHGAHLGPREFSTICLCLPLFSSLCRSIPPVFRKCPLGPRSMGSQLHGAEVVL